jgi:DNA-binding response OmpR family regulator
MRSHSVNRDMPDRPQAAFVRTKRRTSEQRSLHLLNSSTRPGQHRNFVQSTPTPPTSWSTELQTDIDGLPILFRFLIEEAPEEMQSEFVLNNAGIYSLLSSTLEKIVDRIRGLSQRNGDSSRPPLAIVEFISSMRPLAELSAPANQTVLRVGPLELDLLDHTAKRGDRRVNLRPREFRLLKYMMERYDKLLTRATLFKDVWHYKFVPKSNLVDVYIGRLRRKINQPNEPSMIRSVRGVGFVLSANPLSQDSPTRPALSVGDNSPPSEESACNDN